MCWELEVLSKNISYWSFLINARLKKRKKIILSTFGKQWLIFTALANLISRNLGPFGLVA
jgi:hypothetical protein